MKLSTRQQKIMDEVYADEHSAKATLKIALAFHANTLNDTGKRRDTVWQELADQYELNLEVNNYIIKRVDGFFQVTEIKD